ncbi:MAG TPA: S46 family peptidase [Steroidobacteraceae bacterium]|nr:S46 family peptidase [Steroidobacteraceae bacterium]
MTRWSHAACAATLVLLFSAVTHADEGMWTFHGFPFDKANAALKTQIDQAWLDHVRAATVRLANCTGSFVSADGLILTNAHCVRGCLADNSTQEKSYLEDGYLARTRDAEMRCPTQIADVLTGMEDVTARINAATEGKAEAEANDARKAALTQVEQECEAASKLKCQSVSLYGGGQYWLYKYKRYTDLRLVFAPEYGIAAFGGDPDNFQFPRWGLDMSLLRAYEADAPAQPATHLKVNFAGPAAGEAVFVAGHPGRTDRGLTPAQLKQQRNLDWPQYLMRYSELRGRLIQFSQASPENARIAADLLHRVENSIKVRRKMLDTLHDDNLLARKTAEQQNLQSRVAKDEKLRAAIGDPWKEIDVALANERAIYEPYLYLEQPAGFQGRLIGWARTLVRGTAERDKPNTERFREYTDAALPRVERQLTAKLPVYPELEILELSFSLERMREWLGQDHPVVRKLLGSETPAQLARRVVTNTRLAEPAVRLELWTGGKAEVAASTDPMIALWRSVDAEARALRKKYEDEVEGPIKHASELIARARFATLGTSVYPDATFTLRLNWGTVQGWNEQGKPVEPFTRLARAFERATGAAPFRLPDSWMRVKDQLDLGTPFDLATNNDIVGGNSGSPLINAQGELVGLMFDGNIHSISGAYWFDPSKNRGIAVHPAIMREALHKVYGADALLEELSR